MAQAAKLLRAVRMLTENRQCNLCGNAASKRCAGCGTVWYCSAEHQKQDWKAGHKLACLQLQSLKGDEKWESDIRESEAVCILARCNPLRHQCIAFSSNLTLGIILFWLQQPTPHIIVGVILCRRVCGHVSMVNQKGLPTAARAACPVRRDP